MAKIVIKKILLFQRIASPIPAYSTHYPGQKENGQEEAKRVQAVLMLVRGYSKIMVTSKLYTFVTKLLVHKRIPADTII